MRTCHGEVVNMSMCFCTISQAIQKNNLTLMPGVGLKKKGEEEVSVYYNMAH